MGLFCASRRVLPDEFSRNSSSNSSSSKTPRTRYLPWRAESTRPDTVKDPAKREFVVHGSCLLQARLGLLSGQRSRRSTALPPSSRRRMREFMCTQTRGFVAVHETGMARSCHCGFPAIVRLSMEERT